MCLESASVVWDSETRNVRYGPPFTEIARDDVIRLFPTESSFDIGPFLRRQLCRAHSPREGN